MPSLLNTLIDINELKEATIEQKPLYEYEQEAINAMIASGMEDIPMGISFDSYGKSIRYHRFGKRDRGWYFAYVEDNIPVVVWGDWSDETRKGSFRGSNYYLLDAARKAIFDETVRIKNKLAEEEQQRKYSEAAQRATRIWESTKEADAGQEYITRKKLKGAYGSHVNEAGELILPLFNQSGEIISVETIPTVPGQDKQYTTGSTTKYGHWWIGDKNAQFVYLCEGFATAASVFEATNKTVFISYSSGNMERVATMLHSQGKIITIIADNDTRQAGEKAAIKASKATGCNYFVIPNNGNPKVSDANDYEVIFGNLKDILPSVDKAKSIYRVILADEIIGRPSPIRWLIRGWIPQKSVGMVHGPSGSGKTNFIMDIACTLATASMDKDNPTRWADGRRCRRCNIIYLCGEGYDGLKGRLNAWMVAHDRANIGNLGIIAHPFDLDKNDTVQSVITAIREGTPFESIDVIIIDTVNRYMSGDENSAQDTRTFLNLTANIQEAFDCTLIYVHHTGNDEANIKRGRGSSAWRGALDFEISVVKNEESGLRTATPVKMKDGELRKPIYGDIVGIPLGEGWNDPDEPDEPYTAPIWKYMTEEEAASYQPHSGGVWDDEIVEAFAIAGKWNDRNACYVITKDDWKNYLKGNSSMSSRQAEDFLKPGKIVREAMSKKAISAVSGGWKSQDLAFTERISQKIAEMQR